MAKFFQISWNIKSDPLFSNVKKNLLELPKTRILQIFLMSLVPVLGYIFLDWNAVLTIWAFYCEGLFVGIVNTIKLALTNVEPHNYISINGNKTKNKAAVLFIYTSSYFIPQAMAMVFALLFLERPSFTDLIYAASFIFVSLLTLQLTAPLFIPTQVQQTPDEIVFRSYLKYYITVFISIFLGIFFASPLLLLVLFTLFRLLADLDTKNA